LANTTTKQYIQNANTESTILQSKLTALTNNQQAMMDAMSSIVKSLADLLKQEAHNL
jgi:hypothetical protein